MADRDRIAGKPLAFGARHRSAAQKPIDWRSGRRCIERGWGVLAWWFLGRLALIHLCPIACRWRKCAIHAMRD